MILGIDEVGRGPWAGPLVVGAVVLGDERIEGLTDSKKLTKKRREALAEEIYQKAAGLGLGWVHAADIDEIGLSEALKLATVRAVSQVNCAYSEIIIDGTVNFLAETGKGAYVTTLKKADLLISSVSAASIVAKVARDVYMEEQDLAYPGYGFASHVGYGTLKHREAIEMFGVTPLHRLSFAPLAKYRTTPPVAVPANDRHLSTKQIGDASEELAARYLQTLGYAIVERNWKTKYCEIDIVAEKDSTIYFVEVKHRKNSDAGGGIAAITPKKLQQMTFAAKVYNKAHLAIQSDLRLAVVTTVGESPTIEQYLVLE